MLRKCYSIRYFLASPQSVEQIKTAMDQPFSLDMLKAEANTLVKRFRALEPTIKQEIRAAFPIVATVVESKENN